MLCVIPESLVANSNLSSLKPKMQEDRYTITYPRIEAILQNQITTPTIATPYTITMPKLSCDY